MRPGSFLWISLLTGCAGQPPPAAAPRPVVATAASQPAQGAPDTHKVKLDANNIVEAQQAGYKFVNKNGEPLYCRIDPITGSRIQTRTVCLTEQELQTQMSNTQQAMGQFSSHQVSPSGH
jgi:hypothetical protein